MMQRGEGFQSVRSGSVMDGTQKESCRLTDTIQKQRTCSRLEHTPTLNL